MIDKVKIGWKEYKISKEEKCSILVVDGAKCYDQISYDRQMINLRKENSEEQNKVTLIHEVLHGISEMYNLNLSEDIVKRLVDDFRE